MSVAAKWNYLRKKYNSDLLQTLSGNFALFDAADTSKITLDGSNRVSAWEDSLGSGMKADAATADTRRPDYSTIEGIPSLEFDASNSERLFSDGGTLCDFTKGKSGFTVVMLCSTNELTTQQAFLSAIPNSGSGQLFALRMHSDSYLRTAYNFGGNTGDVKGDEDEDDYGTNARQYLAHNKLQIIAWNLDAENGTITTWKNGVKGYTVSVTGAAFEDLTANTFNFGSGGGSQYLDGHLCKALLRDEPSTDAEMRQLCQYVENLAGKQLLVKTLLYYIGDSIAQGLISTEQKRPHIGLEKLYNDPTVVVENRAVGGTSTFNLDSVDYFAPSFVSTWWDDYPGVKKGIILHTGTNDVGQQVDDGTTPHTESEFVERIDDAITGYANAGIKTVYSNIIARNDQATAPENTAYNNKIKALNTLTASGLTDVDAVANGAGLTKFDPDNHATEVGAPEYSDDLHLDGAGYDLLTPVQKTAMDTALAA